MSGSRGQLRSCRPRLLLTAVVVTLCVHVSLGLSSPFGSGSVSKAAGIHWLCIDIYDMAQMWVGGWVLTRISCRFLLMTYDRETTCGIHQTASACKADKTNRCVYFEDILSVVGEKEDSPAGSSDSSSSDSSGQSDSNSSSSASDGLKLYLTSLLMADVTADNGQPPAAAAADVELKVMIREQLLQQQQHLHELMMKQQGLSGHHTLTHQQYRHAAANTGSPSSSSSTRQLDYAVSARAAPTSGSSTSSTASSKVSSSSSQAPKSSSSASKDTPRGGGPVCMNADLLENYVFTKSAYSNPLQAPLALHCPGSRAHELLQCMRITSQASCRSQPLCVFVAGSAAGRRPDMCVSRYFSSLSPQQLKKFTSDITMAEPAAVGSCDGACWMRQAMLCNRTTDRSSCSALSFCRPSPSGSCTPRLYSSDEFGASVQEYMGECVDVDNRRDCEGLRLRLVSKGSYRRWQMPSSASRRCSVPSIRGLLGTRTALERQQQQEQGSRLIAALGSMEEREAELQAAAAAAAAAANAAQLVSGRGPVVLRQIYFHEKQP